MEAGKTSTRARVPVDLVRAQAALSALRSELGGTSSLFAASQAAERGAALAEQSGLALRRMARRLVNPPGPGYGAGLQRAGRLLDKSTALLSTGLRLRAIACELRSPLEAELGLRGAQALVEQGLALVGGAATRIGDAMV